MASTNGLRKLMYDYGPSPLQVLKWFIIFVAFLVGNVWVLSSIWSDYQTHVRVHESAQTRNDAVHLWIARRLMYGEKAGPLPADLLIQLIEAKQNDGSSDDD